jgi:hypothetical protein
MAADRFRDRGVVVVLEQPARRLDPLGRDPERARSAASSDTRPLAASAANSCAKRGSGRSTTSESSASCSSSASRGASAACSRTRADRVAVQLREIARGRGQAAAQRHGARAALLERCVVEERVRLAVQDLVRERRRLARVAQVQRELAALDRARDLDRAVDVERLVQAVVHRLRTIG